MKIDRKTGSSETSDAGTPVVVSNPDGAAAKVYRAIATRVWQELETVQGKGTFISGASRDFILEERLRRIEEHLDAAAKAAREADIPLDKLTDILRLFYEQEDQNI